MSYRTIVPANQVSETELIALIEQINKVTKSDLKIEQLFVIETEDSNLTTLLDSLMAALTDASEPTAKRNGKVRKTKKPAMTSHQVRIEQTGEIISTQAFNKRIAAGDVPDLINVYNAKGELLVVMEGKLVKGPQS